MGYQPLGVRMQGLQRSAVTASEDHGYTAATHRVGTPWRASIQAWRVASRRKGRCLAIPHCPVCHPRTRWARRCHRHRQRCQQHDQHHHCLCCHHDRQHQLQLQLQLQQPQPQPQPRHLHHHPHLRHHSALSLLRVEQTGLCSPPVGSGHQQAQPCCSCSRSACGCPTWHVPAQAPGGLRPPPAWLRARGEASCTAGARRDGADTWRCETGTSQKYRHEHVLPHFHPVAQRASRHRHTLGHGALSGAPLGARHVQTLCDPALGPGDALTPLAESSRRRLSKRRGWRHENAFHTAPKHSFQRLGSPSAKEPYDTCGGHRGGWGGEKARHYRGMGGWGSALHVCVVCGTRRARNLRGTHLRMVRSLTSRRVSRSEASHGSALAPLQLLWWHGACANCGLELAVVLGGCAQLPKPAEAKEGLCTAPRIRAGGTSNLRHPATSSRS